METESNETRISSVEYHCELPKADIARLNDPHPL